MKKLLFILVCISLLASCQSMGPALDRLGIRDRNGVPYTDDGKYDAAIGILERSDNYLKAGEPDKAMQLLKEYKVKGYHNIDDQELQKEEEKLEIKALVLSDQGVMDQMISFLNNRGSSEEDLKAQADLLMAVNPETFGTIYRYEKAIGKDIVIKNFANYLEKQPANAETTERKSLIKKLENPQPATPKASPSPQPWSGTGPAPAPPYPSAPAPSRSQPLSQSQLERLLGLQNPERQTDGVLKYTTSSGAITIVKIIDGAVVMFDANMKGGGTGKKLVIEDNELLNRLAAFLNAQAPGAGWTRDKAMVLVKSLPKSGSDPKLYGGYSVRLYLDTPSNLRVRGEYKGD